ncbi:amino acid ABC transporter permease [Cupriavidus sp. BIS7]|uniref:amino acid ABC transporter permease n=1 Tax=Cupriavidus sp. BIS7 TaxID=1217718 RepID=UPI000378E1D2|nr:amino acid ABC transporter permease [Cupriavidus sp. BIS7]
MESLDFSFLNEGPYVHWFIMGAVRSILLFLSSWVCGFALALVIVALRSSPIRPIEKLCEAFVGYHRNVPGLVQIFFWYFGISQVLPASWQSAINAHNGELLFALIALALNTAAYMSEDLRSGIRSLPLTQMEAARALGLTYVQAIRRVILPQAVRVSVPPLINQSLSLFKSTSLAMVIGVSEATYAAKQVENETFHTFEAFAIASAFYLCISFLIMGLGSYAHSRLGAAAKGAR